ncbi:MAG: hypothetical protein GYA57_07650 [Myxococcales bacterium]|nr:hypothetical protein [Myxococcales bacterium]
MLKKWMRLAHGTRPWMVAVALAGGVAASPSCENPPAPVDAGTEARDECCNYEYGPPSCYSDEDCQEIGANYFCGPMGVCEWRSGPDADADADDVEDECCNVEYGPPPCYSDEDCAYMGADWVCGAGGWCVLPPISDADADVDVIDEDVTEDVEAEADAPDDGTGAGTDGDAALDVPDDGADAPDA